MSSLKSASFCPSKLISLKVVAMDIKRDFPCLWSSCASLSSNIVTMAEEVRLLTSVSRISSLFLITGFGFLAFAFGCVVLFWFGGALTLVLTIIRGKNLFFNRRIRGVVIRFLFPLLVVVGKCLGISKARTRRSFIAINNQLVLAEAKKVGPDRLLLLLWSTPAS